MNEKIETINRWIDQYSVPLLKRAMYLVSDKEDAEDLVQDVFINAFESYTNFKGNSSPLTWLMRILKNKVADFYRKKYRHNDQISLDYFFDESGSWKSDDILYEWNEEQNLLDDKEFHIALEECLEGLPLKWKIPVKLYYLEEKKAAIVCQETGITTTNLWKILQRSRLQLRACLENNWFNTQN
ncbi:sigma-70 family RNA polymerase sigma factor [Sphingobacterium kitahiroshimense]|jgi:RNA polymerase sigma-70 factor (ECF subfamily)|uniref:RNA polymerase sigma factor n=2 Tax=Sphingobacterium TaxID=28453 RepID=A0ABV0BVJ9_9SPHI